MNGSITLTQKGSFKNTYRFLHAVTNKSFSSFIEPHVREITEALAKATPVDTGKTAASWSHRIVENEQGIKITWSNSNTANGIPIVLLLYYGHGTPSGRFVQGRDFITPVTEPMFKNLIDKFWKEVKET